MQHLLGTEDELKQEILATMSPEERLHGLSEEERLQGLTPEQLKHLRQGLEQRRPADGNHANSKSI